MLIKSENYFIAGIFFSIYKNLIYPNAIGCTIFLVNPSRVYTNKFGGFPTLEHATYNWPWEKHGFSKSKTQIIIVWPCDLLIDIANAKPVWKLQTFE